MVEKESDLAPNLKRPLGMISTQCKGRSGEKFHQCQRLLSQKCLPLHKSGDFQGCLKEKADLLPVDKENE
ncbi:MAG: hypothetical protein HQ539_02835 [Parcubacteria group bacterium]|nr:hypothetical protein [Parcubacteria group bacterium]